MNASMVPARVGWLAHLGGLPRGRARSLDVSVAHIALAAVLSGVEVLLDSGLPQVPARPVLGNPWKDVRPGRDQHGVSASGGLSGSAVKGSRALVADGRGVEQQREQHRNIAALEVV